MQKILHNRWIIAGIIAVLVVAGGFGIYSALDTGSSDETAAPMQTAKARTGDIKITVSGAGYLVSTDRVELGFLTGGAVSEINSQVGQEVAKGQVLARLDDSSSWLQLATKELVLQSLISPDALNVAEIASLNAKDDLSTSLASLQYLISRTVYNSEIALLDAQAALEEKKTSNAGADEIALAEAAVSKAQKALVSAQYYYRVEYIPSVLDYEPTDEEISLARAQVRTAELAVEDANLYILRLSSEEPCADLSTVGAFTAQLNQACLDIELARLVLDGTNLVAPFDAKIANINMAVGQVVTSAPVMTLATTELNVHFYIEEADLAGVQAGLPVNISFDAYPDVIFQGVVERIDPELELVDGAPAVSIWSTVELPGTDQVFLSGMTTEVEVVIGAAQNTVLVPSQALRELAPGSYAVFVVQSDNSLKLTPVTIGLRDMANVQVLSGLKAGDVVSTGVIETK